jgi:ubiquinol-cytochrome c reductase cytochrome b subunit
MRVWAVATMGLSTLLHAVIHPSLPMSASGDQAPPEEPTEPFTHHLRRLGAFGLVLLGAVGILSVLAPPAVGPAPVAGLEITKPPWNFWWMFTLENWFGLTGILYGSGVLFLLLIALPFVDRSPRRYWRDRPVAMALGLLVLLALALLTVVMPFTTAETHL